MIRFEFDGRVEERGGQQFVSGRGVYGDAFTRIYRPEPHGMASMPVAGAKGILIPMPGNPDFAVVFGGEHPALRPRDLPSGGKAIYDASGNIIKLVGGGGLVIDVAGRNITVTAGTWTINGNAVINGDLQVNGNIVSSGSITDSDGDGGA